MTEQVLASERALVEEFEEILQGEAGVFLAVIGNHTACFLAIVHFALRGG
jgi:hypothetical protein